MLLGAFLDAGADAGAVRTSLDGLGLAGWELAVVKDRQQGFAGTRARVTVHDESHPARHLADVEALLGQAALADTVRSRALGTFRRLFAAEAEVHGVRAEETHLHELGAVDAVIDIVGVCAAVASLAVERISCSPVPVGRGTVRTAHGVLPVPAPAVSRLLHGVPLAGHCADGEMTTPTGAALLATLVDDWRDMPAGRVVATGCGLGTRTFPEVPNFLRVHVLEPVGERLAGRPLTLVETTIDDVTGERIRWVLDRAVEAGALDAWSISGVGRKGRPISELRLLCEVARADAVTAALFSEGATLGVRYVQCSRPELRRDAVTVETSYGPIPVKVGYHRGVVVSVKPEHDACGAAARRSGATLAAVVEAALRAAPQVGAAE